MNNKHGRKGALELSINMIVVIIISLVILTSGIYLVTKFFKGSEEIYDQLDSQTRARLQDALSSNIPVNALYDHATIKAGETDPNTNGIGIFNVLNYGTNFRIVLADNAGLSIMYGNQNSAPFRIEKGERYVETIWIAAPLNATPGEHDVLLNVEYFNNTNWIKYKPKVIYVTVE